MIRSIGGRGYDVDDLFKAEHPMVSYFPHFGQLWASNYMYKSGETIHSTKSGVLYTLALLEHRLMLSI